MLHSWLSIHHSDVIYSAEARLAPSQWETALQSNGVSQWLGGNLESALWYIIAVPWSYKMAAGYGEVFDGCNNSWKYRSGFWKIITTVSYGQVTKVQLSCYLVLLSGDSKTR